jgi:hypothetical protein
MIQTAFGKIARNEIVKLRREGRHINGATVQDEPQAP